MTVNTSIDNHIGCISFSNPPLHYMTADLLNGIYRCFHELLENEAVKVIVLRNPTKGFFITHYSLKEIGDLEEVEAALKRVGFDLAKYPAFSMKLVKWLYKGAKLPVIGALFQKSAELFKADKAFAYVVANKLIKEIMFAPKPVIAMIGGNAQGYGMELSLACDFRVMAKGAYHLAQIESLVGLIPGAGGMHNLCNIVGSAKALELSMLGTRLNAEAAEKIGLIYKAVPEDMLLKETETLANQLAKRTSLSLKHIKSSLQKGRKLPIEKALLNDEVGFLTTTLSQSAKAAFKRNDVYLESGKTVNETFNQLDKINL